ncbi:HNH endonuclease [Blastococcus sp. TF02A-30]|nr:HNH endonuclease [Blastococcus sp. TF02A-30]
MGTRSRGDTSVELERVQALKGALAAYEAHLVMELAEHSSAPAACDPRPGSAPDGFSDGPIPGTSEFFVDELAVIVNSSSRSAGRLAAESYVLTRRLPEVWTSLADGILDWPRARVFVDVLGSTAAGVAEAVSARVVARAATLSLGGLRRVLTREVLEEDPDAAERRREDAERAADVTVQAVGDGMSRLVVDLSSPVAAACWTTIDQLAWMLRDDGDRRPIGLLRTLVFADLCLRPWDTSRPPVTAHLDVLVPLPSLTGAGCEAAEVGRQPITAEHVREVLRQLGALGTGGLEAPPGGSLRLCLLDDDGTLLASTTTSELRRLARSECPAHAGECGCPVMGPPPPVDRYRPGAGQRRFTEARDRTCRQPNCGQPVARADLDHVVPHGEGGVTACHNLCCLCRHHHRLKTLAPGWRFVLLPNGVLEVTTPGGITRSTHPPGLRDPHEQRAVLAPPPPDAPPPF